MQQLTQCDPVQGANLFHGTLAQAMIDWLMQFSHDHNISKVMLSGGCFLNKVLTEELIKVAAGNHLSLVLPRQLPPNDGGISLGQAWIAGNSI